MDNQRLLTWGLFLMMAWFTYQTWQTDYHTPPPAAEPQAPVADEALPTADAPPTLPEVSAPNDEPPATAATPTTEAGDAPLITVTTDVFELTIDTRGGTIVEATMLKYPVSKENPDLLVQTLSRDANNFGLIRSGLRGGVIADHTVLYDFESDAYTLGSDDSLVVPLTWTNEQGLRVEKRLTFTRGSYQIDIDQTVTNSSGEPWSGDFYVQLLRRSFPADRSMFDVDSYSFDGAIVYDGDSSEKLDRDDLLKGESYNASLANGWAASIEHHFLNAIVPVRDVQHAYRVDTANSTMIASVVSPKRTVAPGQSHTFEMRTFVGPKLQSQLEELAPSLKLTVDYGILTILSQPMFWLLSLAYDYVANWGLAIILVTILIKLVFYKLTESSGRSMAKMRTLQPRMQALQERYKDDRQALSQAMMDLYKREKVNPVAGCLPILVQMPFFLAFYWVLVESVEMRQAPFVLWLTDLSSRDPYFILPLIMGAAMLIQQKLNPAPTDPVQARVMQIMPIMFTGFFAFFPSGLVLYWATNTVLSIAQQWKINRVVEAETKAEKNKGGKSRKGKTQGDD